MLLIVLNLVFYLKQGMSWDVWSNFEKVAAGWLVENSLESNLSFYEASSSFYYILKIEKLAAGWVVENSLKSRFVVLSFITFHYVRHF